MSAVPDNSLPFPASSHRRPLVPTAAWIVLGVTLRKLREDRGLTVTGAARQIRVSTSKLSRLERAESPPIPRDVADLATYYKVDQSTRAELVKLAQRAGESEWCDKYQDYAGHYMKRLMALESEAAHFITYEARLVPGLLQTSDYARQIMTDTLRETEDEEIDKRVELRMERQRRFLDSVPQSLFLVEASVLQRPVGGPKLMAEQCELLRERTRRAGTSIRFVPLNAPYLSNHGSMTYLRFWPGGPPQTVYVEGDDEATYRTNTEEVERRLETLLRIGDEAALSIPESRRLLDETIAYYRSEC
ncbi:helix-turn-helix transcriptional regulator [Streptomyces sp. NPDC047046]|uniref:helix-turn-helix domain-containing protein n=1 Tax=Streptomyces sp. NPDC047046 TaxID=3155378 RepID=UPI0033D074FF